MPNFRTVEIALVGVAASVLVGCGDFRVAGSRPGVAEQPVAAVEQQPCDRGNPRDRTIFVCPGDTLISLSRQANVTATNLAKANNITDGKILAGRTVAYVGDYNNVARSLAEVSAMLGMHIRFACPHGFDAPLPELERFALLGAASVEQSTRPAEAVAGAHAVHTDTWVSMGQESEKQERLERFEGYIVDDSMMALADPSAVFMHCLPAYRGIEVAASVIDGPQSVVIQQGHNRLHAARGALAHLLGVRP